MLTWNAYRESFEIIQGDYKMENEITGYCQVVGCMEHISSTAENPYCSYHQGKDSHDDSKLLTKWDYECTVNSQSACNATGLIYSLNDLRDKLWDNARRLDKGTEWVNHHPILQLYAYQLAHLCHGREPIEWEGWNIANAFCKGVSEGLINPDTDYQDKAWYALVGLIEHR